MRAPIHSRKHIVQISQATVTQAVANNEEIIEAIEGAATTPDHIAEGAVVKAVWIEFWLGQASATIVGSYTLVVYKNPGSGHGITAGEMAALHDYTNKKNILFTSQALSPPTDGGLIPVLKQWIKIPKGKQRFGLADKLTIGIRNNTATDIDINYCGVAIYKEYT